MANLPQPGDSWIGLHIEAQIGDGTAVRVFAAHDPELDRRVALKVLDPEGLPDEWVDRFVRDAEIAGRLGHPRIIPVLRAGRVGDVGYVVMPFIPEGDLRDELTRGPLSVDDATNVVGRIGGALDRTHAAGLVHRNVRPANILRTEFTDKVFLAGHGLIGRPLEHPEYAAPELIRGEDVSSATDIYSLGAVLFECLTGRVPFPAETTSEMLDAHLEGPAPKVTDLRPDLASGLDHVVATAMAKDPADRYESGQAVVDAIMKARAAAPVRTTPLVAAPVAAPPEPEVTAATPMVVDAPDEGDVDATAALPVVEPDFSSDPGERKWRRPPLEAERLPDGTIDGEALGVFEDDETPSRLGTVVGSVLFVAVLAVGLLTWRAVNTEAELILPDPPVTTTTTTVPTEPEG